MNLSESYKKRLQELSGIKTPQQELESIAKQAVIDIGEEPNCNKEGKCAQISEEIYNQLKKRGIDCDIIKVSAGYIKDNPQEFFTTHYYVFVYNGHLVVDTQLWQIGLQPKNLESRKCVFVWEEYNDLFSPTETKRITESFSKDIKPKENTEHNILNKPPEEIIKYVGNDTSGFNNREDAIEELNYLLNTNFPHGLKNIPNKVILYRVVLIENGEKINEEEIGEHFIANPKLIDISFLEKIGVIDNWSEDSSLWLLKCLTSKENIDIDRTIGHRLLYPRENEFTVFNGKQIKVIDKKEIKKSKLSLSENKNLNDDFIFHGTNNGAAYHIQKHGGMKLNAANNNETYISFTSNLKVAQYYATMKGGNSNDVILRIKRTPDFFLSPKFKKNKGHEWITTREIPLRELEIKTPGGWVPLENWDIVDQKTKN